MKNPWAMVSISKRMMNWILYVERQPNWDVYTEISPLSIDVHKKGLLYDLVLHRDHGCITFLLLLGSSCNWASTVWQRFCVWLNGFPTSLSLKVSTSSMALVVMCGQPCSGKTAAAACLAVALHTSSPDLTVRIIDESSLHLRRNDSYKGIWLFVVVTFFS